MTSEPMNVAGAVPEAAVEAAVDVWLNRAGWDPADKNADPENVEHLREEMRAFLSAALPHMGVDTAGDIKAIAVRAIGEAQTIGDREGVETGSLSWWWGEALTQRRRAIVGERERDAAIVRAEAAEAKARDLSEQIAKAIEVSKRGVGIECHASCATAFQDGLREAARIARAQADTTETV